MKTQHHRTPGPPEVLYHFTCLEHLGSILSARSLKLVESNIDPIVEHAGPDVVWLTSTGDVKNGHGLEAVRGSSGADKFAVRFTVKSGPHCERWKDFSSRHGIKSKWFKTLDSTGGGTSFLWYVSTTAVPSSDWLEIRLMKEGRTIDLP
jgi:hypothetical protein